MEACRQHWGRHMLVFPQVGVNFHKTSPDMSRHLVAFDFLFILLISFIQMF